MGEIVKCACTRVAFMGKTYVFTPALIAQDGSSKRQTDAVKRAVHTRHLAAGKRLFASGSAASGDAARERTLLNKTQVAPAISLTRHDSLVGVTGKSHDGC